MSQQASEWAISQELPKTEKFILLALAALNDGCVLNEFDVKKISAITGETQKTVRFMMWNLDSKGVIRMYVRDPKAGTGVYEFNSAAYLVRKPAETAA